MVLMDHLKSVVAQAPHNGMSPSRISAIFGPLLICTAHSRYSVPPEVLASAAAAGLPPPPPVTDTSRRPLNYLDVRLAGTIIEVLLDLWPGRSSKF